MLNEVVAFGRQATEYIRHKFVTLRYNSTNFSACLPTFQCNAGPIWCRPIGMTALSPSASLPKGICKKMSTPPPSSL